MKDSLEAIHIEEYEKTSANVVCICETDDDEVQN